MKAIILAAGVSSRLEELTKETPKCLLHVNGKSILQYQLDAYRQNGIEDISLIKGFQKDKIDMPGIHYFINDEYLNNNVLGSLMYAESKMDDDFIASYSDIIVTKEIVKQLLENDDELSVLVDMDWTKNYIDRENHPIEEAEKVIFDKARFLRNIGKKLNTHDPIDGEFVGMMKCNATGAQTFKHYFHQAKQEFDSKPFVNASQFKNAYLTDMLQYMVEQGEKVKCVCIHGGWKEIDTVEDFNKIKERMER